MASIDFQGAKNEIEKIFNDTEGKRKIVFWYDAPANFKEDIINEGVNNCRVLICDKNEFEIKKTIEHDDLESNILVYVPSERPIDQENWLLDILMYCDQEYYADTVALIMRRYSLTNPDVRKAIEDHQKFFDNEARSKKLLSYITLKDNTTKEELKLGMMASLVKSSNYTVDSILTELVFDDSNKSKYNELLKYKFEEFLWDKICDYFNYDGDLKVESLIKKFMFTTFLEQVNESGNDAFTKLPSFYEQYIIKDKGANDAHFFVDKIKSDKRYEILQGSLADLMNIKGLISSKNIASLEGSDVFECFDIYIIEKIAESLQSGSLDYEAFERIIYNRVNSMWANKYDIEYRFLLHTIKFLKRIDKPILVGLTANEYIDKYVNDYYRIDYEYRTAVTSYKQIENPSEIFENLSARIEGLYQDKYLNVIGREYSNALNAQKGWNFYGNLMTRDFYQHIQKNQFKKLFVIISDGLRFEIGHELYEQIKIDPILKGGVEIDYAISTLPSETRQGMAALLPYKELTYSNKEILIDGMSTKSVEDRNAILKSRNSSYAAIQFEKINSFTQKELRQYMQDKSLVYIYHDVIDNAGEHNESKVFDVTKSAIDEITALVRKLYNNLQVSNFYITADHGFVYRRNAIPESDKYAGITSLDATEAKKRYIIEEEKDIKVPYALNFNIEHLSNDKLEVITPNSYDLFKTQGSGLQYVHGGASLQETIVPVIHISELRSRKLTDSIGPVGVRIKSLTRKITNRSFTLEFEQYEKVEDKKQAITCVTYIVDENDNKVSNEYKFVANSSSDDPTTRVTRVRFTLKNVDFDRNKPYYLILKNEDNMDEYIEKEVFKIDIIGFKMF